MARKRITETPAIKNWEEVDAALREIAEAELALGDIEAELNRQIIGAKKVAEQESKPYADRSSKLERDVKEFVTDHRDELGKAKSRSLNFGEVGFRLSTTISVPKAKEKVAEIVRRLKARQMTDCIIVKEKISKDALRKYGEDTVNAVGATWKQKDTFGYEVFKDKVERTSSPGLLKGRGVKVDIFTTSNRYRIIYADPPWRFGSKEPTGKRGGLITSPLKRSIRPYQPAP